MTNTEPTCDRSQVRGNGPESGEATVRIRSCADLLSQFRIAHWFSCGLTAATALALLVNHTMYHLGGYWLSSAVLIVILGVYETVLAVRVGFDAALLRQLTERPYSDKRLVELDHALLQLKLLPAHKAGRALETRLSGCLTLFKQQVGVCGLQVVCLLSAALAILTRSG